LLTEALAGAVGDCITLDDAQAVIIGGGPLGEAAEALRARFDKPVLGPIPSAVERIIGLIGEAARVPQAV
jgi:Asp/Glu/hydantoin racemase